MFLDAVRQEQGAPKGDALIHLAKFLGTSIEPNPREDQQKLEEFLELMQPGWREVLVKSLPFLLNKPPTDFGLSIELAYDRPYVFQ